MKKQPAPQPIRLNDEYKTIIYLQPGDDREKVKQAYEEKLKSGYSIREDHHKHFNSAL